MNYLDDLPERGWELRNPSLGTHFPIAHELKCWPEYFSLLLNQVKHFDLRKRKRGRVFLKDQYLLFREWEPSTEEYTGRWLVFQIGYVLRSEEATQFGFEEGLGGDILDLAYIAGNQSASLSFRISSNL